MNNKNIHRAIKTALGYKEKDPDKIILSDWKQKISKICKPCWEIKYCPYGPLVEQSPILPPLRSAMIKRQDYLKKCLETGIIGSKQKLDEKTKALYQDIISDAEQDPSRLAIILNSFLLFENELQKAHNEGRDPLSIIGNELGPIEKNIPPFPLCFEEDIPEIKMTEELEEAAKVEIERMKCTIRTGEIDHTKPIDDVRREILKSELNSFNPESYPESIPQVIHDAVCNVFGHICPVFFVCESVSETSEERRRGRYIPFKIKMRVVRRDNYTCQHCNRHLKDDEVEFDHIIPVSKGGSSEEQNIRLTCFDCNREKSNQVQI